MVSLYQAIMLILNIIWYIMIAQIIMSWLINFQVLNVRQPAVSQIWSGLNAILEPGMLVRHPTEGDWGIGQVQSNIGDRITVNFEHRGKVVIDGRHVTLVLVYDV